jgi:hypothetical protein
VKFLSIQRPAVELTMGNRQCAIDKRQLAIGNRNFLPGKNENTILGKLQYIKY